MVILIVQYNCRRGYKSTVMVLEIALSIKTGMVMLQKPFIGNREISHSAFNFYWSQGKRSEIRVVTTIRKDLIDKFIAKNRTDLVNHPYFIFLKIRELDQQSKKPKKKTRALNVYDNHVSHGCILSSNNPPIRQALKM